MSLVKIGMLTEAIAHAEQVSHMATTDMPQMAPGELAKSLPAVAEQVSLSIAKMAQLLQMEVEEAKQGPAKPISDALLVRAKELWEDRQADLREEIAHQVLFGCPDPIWESVEREMAVCPVELSFSRLDERSGLVVYALAKPNLGNILETLVDKGWDEHLPKCIKPERKLIATLGLEELEIGEYFGMPTYRLKGEEG